MTARQSTSVVFVHDHCFLTDKQGRIYSEGKITDAVIQRMHPLAETIVIVSRLRQVEETSGLVQLTDTRIRMSPVKGLVFSQIFGIYLLRNMLTLWREFGSARIVVLRLPCLMSGLVAPIIWLRNTPYAVEVVGFPRDGLVGKSDSIAIRSLGSALHYLTKRIIWNAKGALYVTQYVLQDSFPTKGVSAAASNVELPDEIVNQKQLKPFSAGTSVRVGLIGSMSANYKGIDIAIQAVSILLEGGYDVHLHILGSGNSQPYKRLALDLGCSEAVSFDGIRKGGQEVAEWLDTLDIYIQPSQTEGLPRSLVEAMSRGLPAIASSVGGIPELLKQQWLVEPGKPADLAEKLVRMINSDALRSEASVENTRKASAFNRSSLRKRRADYYKKLDQLLSDPI